MPSFRAAIACIAAVALSACAALERAPYPRAAIYYDQRAFADSIHHDVPAVTGEIVQHGRCVMYVTTPDTNIGDGAYCVYAITKDGIHAASWDAVAGKYQLIKTVRFDEAQQVTLTTFGRARQVQFIEGTRLIAFEFVTREGVGLAKDDGDKAFAYARRMGVKDGPSQRGIVFPRAVVSTTFLVPTQSPK